MFDDTPVIFDELQLFVVNLSVHAVYVFKQQLMYKFCIFCAKKFCLGFRGCETHYSESETHIGFDSESEREPYMEFDSDCETYIVI